MDITVEAKRKLYDIYFDPHKEEENIFTNEMAGKILNDKLTDEDKEELMFVLGYKEREIVYEYNSKELDFDFIKDMKLFDYDINFNKYNSIEEGIKDNIEFINTDYLEIAMYKNGVFNTLSEFGMDETSFNNMIDYYAKDYIQFIESDFAKKKFDRIMSNDNIRNYIEGKENNITQKEKEAMFVGLHVLDDKRFNDKIIVKLAEKVISDKALDKDIDLALMKVKNNEKSKNDFVFER